MDADLFEPAFESGRALDRFALRLSDALAGQPTLPDVLAAVAEGCAEAFDGALARVWLAGPCDRCGDCAMAGECADRSRCLHLVASAGATKRLDGPFHRFPVGARRVGRIAVTLEPFVARGALGSLGLADAAWLTCNRVRSFAATPLLFRDELLGVLATFSRFAWAVGDAAALGRAARLASNAIVTARALDAVASRERSAATEEPGSTSADAAHLRPMAELERDAIVRVLEHTRWRVSGARGAATILGLPASTLASRMLKLGIRRPPRT
jgi:GAF domain-containing protein